MISNIQFHLNLYNSYNMILKPHGIIGANSQFSSPIFLKRNDEIFFLLSFYSCLSLFKLKSLLLKAKSPFVHHRLSILNKVLVKNRTIVILKNGIHVLDYFIPLTRFFYFFKKPNVFFINQFLIIIYDKILEKFITLNPWTFGLFYKFNLPDNIICIQVTGYGNFQKHICFLNSKNEIEIRNEIMQKKMILKLYGIFKFQCFSSDSVNFSNFFIYKFNRKIFTYDFSLKKKIHQFKIKTLDSDTNITFCKKNLIVKDKKYFLLYCTLKDSLKKIKLSIDCNENYFFRIYKNFMLNLKFYHQSMYLYQYSYKNMQFNLIVCRLATKYPLMCLKKYGIIENQDIYMNLITKTRLRKYDYIDRTILKKEERLKLHVTHIQTIFFRQKESFYLIMIFKQFNYPYIWKIRQNKVFRLKIMSLLEKKKQGIIVSISPIKNSNEFCIITYKKNLVCLFDLNCVKYLYKKKNHVSKKKICKIITVFCNTTGKFFISSCFCNVLILWKIKNFRKIQYIKIKNQIYFLKWFCKFNIITIVDYHNQILLMFLNCFFKLKKCTGHIKKINDILIVKNLNFLISSSFDKTIRVWNLFKNKCEFTVKFSYSPLCLAVNKTQNILILGHLFTTGLSVFQIHHKFFHCVFYLYKDLSEQSKKILPIRIKSNQKKSFLLIYKNFYKKNNNNFFIKTILKLKKINKKFFGTRDKADDFFSMNLFRKKFLPKLYLYNFNDYLSLEKTIFFAEIYLNDLVCSLNFRESVNFFLFFYENILLDLKLKNIRTIIKIILNEIKRVLIKFK